LCEIAKTLPDGWQIRVAGEGSSKNVMSFKKLIEESGVAEKLNFVGAKRGSALVDHYTNVLFFIDISDGSAASSDDRSLCLLGFPL
ncbi:Putative UDP-galactose--lipooligosaccharide galactosyltransferase, partial [Lacticaseibacillus rhamnosus MTCC 5462]